MELNKNLYKIEFTNECISEMLEIYEYISYTLKEPEAASRIIQQFINKVSILATSPELYIKTNFFDRLKRNYHRLIIKNYILLYSIDYEQKTIFISHIVYNRRQFFNSL